VEERSANLGATVDPEGIELESCQFEYGVAGSGNPYASTVPCERLPGSGTSPVSVSARVTGLTTKQSYDFRIAIGYHQEHSQGTTASFETLPAIAPSVETRPPTQVTQTSASFNGTVNTEGEEVVSCSFQYGPTDSYGSSARCTNSPMSGRTPVAVSAAVTGLSPDTPYHYRLTVTTGGGTRYGADAELSSLPEPPAVSTGAASQLEEGSAVLSGSVNAHGGALTRCQFQYGTREPGLSVPCSSFPSATGGASSVSASILGLAQGTTYVYRVLASNVAGTSYGAIETFTTPAASLIEPLPQTPPVTPHPSPSPSGHIELGSAVLTASKTGTLIVAVRCQSQLATCVGKITLRTTAAARSASGAAGSSAHTLVLASARFAIANGRIAHLRLRLSPKARRLLARDHVLRARATIAMSSAPAGTTQTPVTLRFDKASAGR
jgi:hypothetical protein